jgi:Zn-dependent protease
MYRATLGIGELFGVPIRVHVATVVAIGVLLALSDSALDARDRLLSVLAAVSAILVHELGHGLMARRFGFRTVGLVLTPLGGVTALQPPASGPEGGVRPTVAIALAGPLASLTVAGALWSLGEQLAHPVLESLVRSNLFFGLLNLLPAAPLDAGRALHALLLPRLGLVRATRLCMALARVVAVVGGAVGLLESPAYALLGAFLFFGAGLEGRKRLVLGVIGPQRVFEAMHRVKACATPFTTLAEAQTLFDEAPTTPALPVCYGDRVVGVVHRLHVLVATLGEASIGLADLMDRHVTTQEGDAPLVQLLVRMRGARCRAAVIRDGGDVVGVVTLEQVAEGVREAIRPPANGASST